MSRRPQYEAKKRPSIIRRIIQWLKSSKSDNIARTIACLSLVAAVFGVFLAHCDSKSTTLQLDNIYTIEENFFGLWSIDPAKATLSYATGMELYNLREYEQAAIKFREAVSDQEKLKGGDDIDVGKIYAVLGLSESYLVSEREKAVADLTVALKIFESNDDQLHVAWCYYYLATMYFERGFNHLNLANEAVEKSIEAANEFCPDGVELISYRIEDKEISFPADYDLSKLYISARYCELMQNTNNLQGKISFRLEDVAEAVHHFNAALEYCSKWSACHYFLDIVLNSEHGAKNEDRDEIIEYIGQITAPEVLNNLANVKIYEFNHGTFDENAFVIVSVYRGADAATFLTNRAMSEYVMRFYGRDGR